MPPLQPAARAFLRHSLIVEFATLSPKQRPFVTPLWFVVDRGVLYITTGPESSAGKNVAAHPEVTLLFAGERSGESGRAYRMRGTATCHRGLVPWRALLRLAVKYYLSPPALRSELGSRRKWGFRRQYYRQNLAGPGYIRVLPTEGEFLPAP